MTYHIHTYSINGSQLIAAAPASGLEGICSVMDASSRSVVGNIVGIKIQRFEFNIDIELTMLVS
jgi:hypothetical protein